jgi:membrane associated rhomboid family serine protease
MNSHDNVRLEIQEQVLVQIEEPISTKKTGVCSWCRRIFNINDVPNQKHHRPVFIIVMCILHIFIYLSTYINITWNDEDFERSLINLFMFFIPCMRPTPHHIRIRIVSCNPWMNNMTCYYDDELKNICFSFMYPHQLWRMVTVNLVHTYFVHLFTNLLPQCLCGIPLERKYGSGRVFVIYWLSNLGACLSSMLNDKSGCKYTFKTT